MKRKAFWLGGVCGVLLAVAALLIVAFTSTGPVVAQGEESQVPDLLRQALVQTGVPVQKIVPVQGDCGSLEYLAVLVDTGTSRNVNMALAFEQATALAARGAAINALWVQVVDASGQLRLEMSKTLEPSSVRISPTPDQATLLATEAALCSAVDQNISSTMSSLGVSRGEISIGRVGNELVLARAGFQVRDTFVAKAALDGQLLQQTVDSCRKLASAANLGISSIVVTVVDASGTTLLDSWVNLQTGSMTSYYVPGIGRSWAPGPSGKVPRGAKYSTPLIEQSPNAD
jgi:hypothetical protein